MKYQHFAYLLITTLLFVACNQTSFQKEIEEIDSLVLEYKNLQLQIDSSGNYIKAQDYYKKYESLINQAKIAGKKLNAQEVKNTSFLTELKLLKRTAKAALKTYKKTLKDIPVNQDHLEKLKVDLENKAYEMEQAQQFIAQEKKLLSLQKKSLIKARASFKESASLIEHIENQITATTAP